MLFSPQIPLQLEPRGDSRFENFVAGPNGAVVDAVKSLLQQPGASLFMHGPQSSGKTHLLNALCHASRDHGNTAFYLALKNLPSEASESLKGLEKVDLVCLDDLHTVAGNAAWEEALFHFINRLRAENGTLAVSSRVRLSALVLNLPDLASRLAWGLRLELAPLEDKDKVRVIHQHAELLGIELREDVVNYLLKHSHRGLARLLEAVDRLKNAAFTAKRRITVPLAREVLKPR